MTVAVIIPTLDPESEMCVRAVDAVTATAPEAFVIVQHDKDRRGFAETCNRGSNGNCQADWVVFLNDDTVVQDGWIAPLLTGPGIAGSRLFYPDGNIAHTGVFLRTDPLGRLEAYNRRVQAQSGPVPAVTGACMAVKRDVWKELEGFDTEFVNGYEDVDFCLRARQAGYEVGYVDESVVVHFESQSPGRFDHAAENVALLQERWGHLLEVLAA